MSWIEEEKQMNETMQQLTKAFRSLVQENQKLRQMNAELYEHAADDLDLERLRKLNKELFTLTGMPSELDFANTE